MPATILRADARSLPLDDDSVDLVVTSPPYFALRSYTDGGEHYEGQIGDEPTPAEFVESLIEVTRECVRVLKPSGSLWVNLGDAFSRGQRFDSGFTAQDAAWLAGVIDSDGSISVRVDGGGRSHVAWTRVGQTKPEVVQRIGQVTGVGQVWQDARGVWNWNAAAQQARWILERIWPWLRIKQRQALAAIDLMTQKSERKRRGSYAMLTEDDLARRELIRQAVLAWNRGEDFPDYEPPAAGLVDLPREPHFIQAKSLMGLPWRYAIRCIDDLGLILRAEVIWSKPNGLPESVTDRVRRSHEQWFHFTVQPRYFSAVDEIREASVAASRPGLVTWAERKAAGEVLRAGDTGGGASAQGSAMKAPNPLGKLPGSVWEVPTQPLKVPEHLGVDHFAAFPMEWPRRIIQGWSPSGICTECGEGRRPAVERVTGLMHDGRRRPLRDQAGSWSETSNPDYHGRKAGAESFERGIGAVIRGYACACPEPTATTRPTVVLDPFGGTGTTALVARALGRHGISVDRSADYCRLASWRTADPGEIARAMQVEKPPATPDDMDSLLDLLA